jgi:hypothetical protein
MNVFGRFKIVFKEKRSLNARKRYKTAMNGLKRSRFKIERNNLISMAFNLELKANLS